MLAMCFKTLFRADFLLFCFHITQIFSFFLGFLFQSIQVAFGIFGLGIAAILVVREHTFPETTWS
jgi:hypothetical protein